MPLTTEQARGLHLALLITAAGVAATVLLAHLGQEGLLPPPVDAFASFLTSCPFRTFQGRPCPLCGMTTAAVHLLNGDLGESVIAHPAPAALAPLYSVQLVYRSVRVARPALRWQEESIAALLPLAAGLFLLRVLR